MDPSINSTLFALACLSNAVGSTLLYLGVGVAPCLLWLVFYLRRDKHPEPKKEIFSVFMLGALMTVPAVALEIFLIGVIKSQGWPTYVSLVISNVVAVAFIEEFAKYAAVWLKEQAVNQNRELDEPVDFVIYMVAAALGFAAVENMLFLLPKVQEILLVNSTLLNLNGAAFLIFLSLFRSLSAILLHTLNSGILGYYMAMAFCHRERKLSLLATGFFVTSCLHGLYNFSIIKSGEDLTFTLATLTIILSMAFTLYILFERLMKMKSVCNIKITLKRRAKSVK